MNHSQSHLDIPVSAEVQELLEEAARLCGESSINSFMLKAATDKARKIIDRENILELSDRDTEKMAQALNEPCHPNNELLKASNMYRKKSQ
ncbi:type II toxin-antitoxin system TacA family antitoxin [Spongorhabdus nitratireducens]